MSFAGTKVVITQLVVDASGAKKGVDDYEAALARARKAANDAGTANTSFDATLRQWTQSLGRADPVLRAQVSMQKALQQQTDLNTRAVQLGIATQEAAAAQLERVRQKYQGYVDKAADAELATTGFSKAMGFLAEAAAPLVGILSAASLVDFAKSAFENAAALNEMAEQAGVSVEAFQAYRAAMRDNGIAADQSGQLIGKLTQTIGQAVNQAGPARDAFNQLGLSAKDLANGVEGALPLIAQALLQIPDATERARLEADLFGRTGQKLESALRDLADPTADLVAKQTALGQVLGHDVTDAADHAADRLDAAFQRMKNAASGPVTFLVEKVADLADGLQQLVTGSAAIAPAVAAAFPGYAAALAAQKAQQQAAASSKAAAEASGSAFFGVPVNNLVNALNGNAVGATPAFSNDNEQKYLATAKQAADLAGLSATRRAQETATIGLANAKLLDGTVVLRDQNGTLVKQVTDYDQARQLVGDIAAKHVESLAAIAEQGQQWQKVRQTFSDYLDQLGQAAKVAGESAAQRQTELAVIQGAQIYQRQRGVEEKDLVRTYDQAVAALGDAKVAQIQWQEAAAQTAAFSKQTSDALALANVALAAGRDGRDLAVQTARAQLDLGRELTDVEKDRLHLLQQINDAARLDDYIAQLKDEASLAGLSADERERQQAVLQAMRITHGELNDAQKQEIEGIVAARQATEQLGNLVETERQGFQGFFQDVFTTGSAKFGNLFKSIEAGFAQLLAWMASQAVMQPIIIPMVQSLTGSSAGALGALGGSGGLSALSGLSSLGSLGGIGSAVTSGLNWLGGNLGFAQSLPLGNNLIGEPMSYTLNGSVFGSTTLGGLLGNFGIGSVIGGMLGGNSLVSGGLGALGSIAATSLLGGTGIGTALGSALGPVGMIAGSLLGAALGNFGASNQSSTAAFSNGGLAYSLAKQGSSQTASLASQAGDQISAVLQALSGAGVDFTNPLSGVNIGNDKSYLYYASGQKQKLSKGGDVATAVSAALDVVLRTVHTDDANLQQVLNHYMQNGGITADNVQQVVTDLGFAKTLANFDFGTTKLTQTQQLINNITDQFDQAAAKADALGLNIADLRAAEQDALQSITDDFNANIQSAIDGITNGPLQQWNTLIDQQKTQLDEAKSAGADLNNVETLQYLQRKQLLMSLTDSERTALEGMIGLADDLAAKVVNAQAAALDAVNQQIQTAQDLISQKNQLAGQYTSAGSSLDQARVGLLVDQSYNRLSPASAYAQSRDQLNQAATAAQGGDLTALGSLSSLAQAFLQNSLAVNASSTAYASDFNYVQSVLTGAKAAADAQAAAAASQAQIAQAQLDTLTGIQTELQKPSPDSQYLQQMLDQLTSIKGGLDITNIDAVAQPINQLIQVSAGTIAQLSLLAAAQVATSGVDQAIADSITQDAAANAATAAQQAAAAAGTPSVQDTFMYRATGGRLGASVTHLATGLDYVPYDGFPNIAHQGEAILNRVQAQDWRDGTAASGRAVVEELRNLRAQVAQLQAQGARQMAASEDAAAGVKALRGDINQNTRAQLSRAI